MGGALLSVRDLTVTFPSRSGRLVAVDRVSFDVHAGRAVGMVGESGSGKSSCAQAILGLSAGRVSGAVSFEGRDLLKASERQLQALRGDRLTMVFQDTSASLNPAMRIGDQVTEPLRVHRALTEEQLQKRAVDLLTMVGFPDPGERVNAYPHELSGGLRQRAILASALACGPALVIADEPTTALDVTVQAQVLDLLRTLQRSQGMALVLITHDIGVVSECCDDVVVLYAGRVMEQGPVAQVLARPRHPYTVGLLGSTPVPGEAKERLQEIPGVVPSLAPPPPGCRFQSRCGFALDRCASEEPPLVDLVGGQSVRCFNPRLAEAA